MKGCVQWNAVYNQNGSHLERVSNLGRLEQ